MLQGEAQPWSDLNRFRRDPMVVPESQRIAKLFDLMRIRRAHMACVVDEYGIFIGVITLEDLIEEIVGDIQDETDTEQPSTAVTVIDETNWEADGLISLTDLERSIGLSIDVQLDANTLSGLFMQRLARMPEKGDEIIENNYQMRVLSTDDHRVGKVHINFQEIISSDENTIDVENDTTSSGSDSATSPTDEDNDNRN
jgi:CBS domain containing-hemolysin-like protein